MPGKHHLRGFKIAKKIGSPLRGSWTMLRIVVGSNPPPPPWKKARSAPAEQHIWDPSGLYLGWPGAHMPHMDAPHGYHVGRILTDSSVRVTAADAMISFHPFTSLISPWKLCHKHLHGLFKMFTRNLRHRLGLPCGNLRRALLCAASIHLSMHVSSSFLWVMIYMGFIASQNLTGIGPVHRGL